MRASWRWLGFRPLFQVGAAASAQGDFLRTPAVHCSASTRSSVGVPGAREAFEVVRHAVALLSCCSWSWPPPSLQNPFHHAFGGLHHLVRSGFRHPCPLPAAACALCSISPSSAEHAQAVKPRKIGMVYLGLSPVAGDQHLVQHLAETALPAGMRLEEQQIGAIMCSRRLDRGPPPLSRSPMDLLERAVDLAERLRRWRRVPGDKIALSNSMVLRSRSVCDAPDDGSVIGRCALELLDQHHQPLEQRDDVGRGGWTRTRDRPDRRPQSALDRRERGRIGDARRGQAIRLLELRHRRHRQRFAHAILGQRRVGAEHVQRLLHPENVGARARAPRDVALGTVDIKLCTAGACLLRPPGKAGPPGDGSVPSGRLRHRSCASRRPPSRPPSQASLSSSAGKWPHRRCQQSPGPWT